MSGRVRAGRPARTLHRKPGRATTFRAMFRTRPVSDRARREPGRPVPPTRGRVTRPTIVPPGMVPGENPGRPQVRSMKHPAGPRNGAIMHSNGNSFASGKTTERQAPLWRWLLGAAPR